MGFTRVTTQAIWLTKYFSEIGLPAETPITILTDSSSSIANSLNDKSHRQTKHIDVKHYFIKDKTKLEDVTFKYMPNTSNLADILSKLLAHQATQKITASLELRMGEKDTLNQEEY